MFEHCRCSAKEEIMHTSKIRKVMTGILAMLGIGSTAADTAQEKLWLQTYDARQKYFEHAVGPLPNDILKMLNMSGVWPGGGLYAIPAKRLGPDLAVYTTFGFTNSDMPTTLGVADFKLDSDGKKATRAEGTLQKKQPVAKRPGAAGYGYEFIVVAQANQDWPLNLLQWAVNAELTNDVGMLDRVEKYDGVTVEQLHVGALQPIDVLISKALPPLPVGTQLPAGKMEVLVATVITPEEMH
jgi:hypothetical protein